MNERSFILTLLVLFFLSSVWLTVRQDSLSQKAKQDFVSIAFTEPGNAKNSDFTVKHTANTSRALTLTYYYENNQKENVSLTLAPEEERTFQPSRVPQSITLRYQDANNQPQEISIYKKNLQ